MPSNKEIITYLSTHNTNTGLVNNLKIKYRPLICPFSKLISYAEKSNSSFDIGCGSGQFCSLLAKFTPVKKIFGIEIHQSLIENAKQLSKDFEGKKEINFETFDGSTLPILIKDYEIVYLIDVLHHIPKKKQEEFIREIYRKISPGTKLIFKDINASHPFVFFNKIHDLMFAGEIGEELKYADAIKLFKNNGFKILDTFTQTVFVYPHYFIVATT